MEEKDISDGNLGVGGSNSEYQEDKVESQGQVEDDIQQHLQSTSSSTTTPSSTSAYSRPREDGCLSRVQTQRDLERNPVVVSRIATLRSQHSGTVGAGLQARPSKKSLRDLPNFGTGKPYPPPLPEKDAYVVEFDGPDDPLHPQNWVLKKKYVSTLQSRL